MQDVSHVLCLHVVLYVILEFQSRTAMQYVLVQGMSWCFQEFVKNVIGFDQLYDI